jgi:hypothetical protein
MFYVYYIIIEAVNNSLHFIALIRSTGLPILIDMYPETIKLRKMPGCSLKALYSR